MKANLYLATAAIVVALLAAACSPAAPTATPAVPTKPAAAPAAIPTPGGVTATPAAAAAGAAVTTPTPAIKIKRGGTVTFSKEGEYPSWDPIQFNSSPYENPVLETLVRLNELDQKTGKSEYAGELAESWQILDPQTVIFKLRKGVKFHDGSDFNAEIAKWVIDRAKTHPKTTVKSWNDFIKSIDVVDNSTIRMNLAYPSALVFPNLTRASGGTGSIWSGMISKAAIDKNGDEYFGSHPVGTGPFKVDQWLKDDRMILKKWEGYWKDGVDGQKLPYVDGMVGRIIRDPAVALTEMKAGTVQVTQTIEPFQYQTIKSSPDMTLRVLSWAPIRFVFGLNQAKPPFKDNLKLRQAAQYAIDRKGIADAIGFGEFLPNKYLLWVPTWPGWDESVPRYEYDPEKAKQLIKEAGYPDGVDFGLIAYPPPLYKQPAEMIQSQWGRVGLRAQLDLIDTTPARAKQKSGDFESAVWGMWPSLDPAQYDRMLKCDGTANWSNYCNPELDKCMLEGASVYDFDKRAEVYKRCLKIVYEDALVGGTHLRPFVLAYRNELKGVRVQAYLMDLAEVWIDK